MEKKGPLTCRQMPPGHLECTLDLSKIYSSPKEREAFKTRYRVFRDSDPDNRHVYRLKGNRLIFESEQLIPSKRINRASLLLVFGNPASHSVTEGMFFSPKKDGKENRFWKHLLLRAGIVDLAYDEGLSTTERNKLRMKCMTELSYRSLFRIGLCVYISMPSSAGGPWSGVAGIRKLLGAPAMKDLERFERDRILKVAKSFLSSRGIVVTFQRNAWEGLRSEGDPNYSIDSAREGKLIGTLRGMANVPLYGVPPTRLVGPCRKVLRKFLVAEGVN